MSKLNKYKPMKFNKVDSEFLVSYYLNASMIAYHLERRGKPDKNERRYLRQLAKLEMKMGQLFRRNGLQFDAGL